MTTVSALTWNIGNPSLKRSGAQLSAILSLDPDILCLTETKASEGCDWLVSNLRNVGYHVYFPAPENGNYGVIIATRFPHSEIGTIGPSGLEARAPIAKLSVGINVIGIYVPSNASTPEKRTRKRVFIETVNSALKTTEHIPTVLLGDLNSVPSMSLPVPFVDSNDAQWVDSLLANWTDCLAADPGPTWFGWRGEKYRYDYCFARGLVVTGGERLMNLQAPGLSDHVGLRCTFESPTPEVELEKSRKWTF